MAPALSLGVLAAPPTPTGRVSGRGSAVGPVRAAAQPWAPGVVGASASAAAGGGVSAPDSAGVTGAVASSGELILVGASANVSLIKGTSGRIRVILGSGALLL